METELWNISWSLPEPSVRLLTSSQVEKTLVYSRWVQIGQLRVLVGEPEESGGHHLIILELTGANVSMYEVEYRGPGQVTAKRLLEMPIVNQAGPALLP